MKPIRSRIAPGRSPFLLCALVFAAFLASCQLASVPTAPSNRYALIIGVQDYPGTGNDLAYPDDDASEFATLLTAQGWTVRRLISTSDITIATDGSPTRANIQSAIAALSTDPDATILIYYSGHGSLLENTAYIIPYDGLTSGGSLDSSKWVAPATLTSWVEAVPARNRLLILDSCYSGAFVTSDVAVDTSPADYSQMGHTTSDTALIAAALSRFNTMVTANVANFGSTEVQVLSAAGSKEFSWDDPAHQNGAFTYYLLQAGEINVSTSLAKGDADGDGVVTVDEAYVYAKAQIKANWDSQYYRNYDAFGKQYYDFLPHISGGTRDVVLYSGS